MKNVKPRPRRTLGPVSDLERHLPADWWRHLFNAVYLETDADVVENPRATFQEVDLVVAAAGLSHEQRVLDLCCGHGRHSLELARRGFRFVTGIDRSRYLIRLARRRARAEGLQVTFREGDARKFRTREPVDAVLLLGNSFGYFDQQADDLAVLETTKRALAEGGTLVLDITDGDWMREHHEPRSWEWIDGDHFVCRERALSADGERLVSREVVVSAEQGALVDQFYAERLYSLSQITALLERAGFSELRDFGTVEGDSTRGQDLGMMAHRLLLSARAPSRVRTASDRQAPSRLTVLLGDPRRPDPVKLNCRFNAEDLATVQRLKHALGELRGYEVSYLDDHDRMQDALRRDPPGLVFNLCDEGHGNDPLKELHVPAMLEVLGIPYTGAGPKCLALCYDKALVRALASSLDIPVPLESYCGPDDQSATLPSTFPALIKPALGDSSFGITRHAVVRDTAGLLSYLGWLRSRCAGSILVQEFLEGPEYTVGIVGNPGRTFRILPVLEVDYSKLDAGLPPILGYESKWDPDSPYWTQVSYREADIDAGTYRLLCDHASNLFERLECRDYARFDFRCDSRGVVKLLEVNPNPGWCWDGKMNIMAQMAGLSYADFLGLVLEAAEERLGLTRAAVGPVPAPA